MIERDEYIDPGVPTRAMTDMAPREVDSPDMIFKAGHLHKSTFDFLMPTIEQKKTMEACRMAAKLYAETMCALLPDGPDKTYVLRHIRETAMWANVAVTRTAAGAPRE